LAEAKTAWEKVLALPSVPERFKTSIRNRLESLDNVEAPKANTATTNTSSLASIGVQITVPDGKEVQQSPNAKLFIIAKSGDQGAPIAVRREAISSFPAKIQLDDSHRMMQSGKSLSEYEHVQISARLSQSGFVKTSAGDWIAQPVTVRMADIGTDGKIDIALVLNEQVQ